MIKGLGRFREFFAGDEESYALIGGAACDILFDEAGLPFRATRDFDVVLCVEVVSAEFGKVFVDFLEVGGYETRQRSNGRKEYYRFHRPSDPSFPAMIELFARRPDTLEFSSNVGISPIPVEEDEISLSAILLDEDYFNALSEARRVIDGVTLVDQRLLIPFKARAFLDLSRRKADGDKIDARHIRKHRADVFRLTQLLPGRGSFHLAESICADLAEFLDKVSTDMNFDYKALKLPMEFADAVAVLDRYYELT